MWEHVKRVHGRSLKASDTKPIPSFFSASSGGHGSRSCSPATVKIADDIVDRITEDLQLLVMVHDDGFRRLMAYLSSGYVVPSATHLAKLVKDQHAQGKKKLSEVI